MLLMAQMRNGHCGTGNAIFLAPLLAAVIGLGCTSGTPSPSVIGTPIGLASELATAFCTAQAACCGSPAATTVADGSTNRDGGTSVGGACGTTSDAGATDGGPSTCVERATLAANQQLALVTAAFGEGLITINQDMTAACVQAYASSSCADLAGQAVPDVQAALDNPACANLFIGYIPVGYRCDTTQECISGSYCLSQATGQRTSSLAGAGTLGVCFPFQQMGEACNTTDDCLAPLTCAATTLTCE